MMIYLSLVRFDVNSIASACIALLFTEVTLVLLCGVIKKLLIGRKWGNRSRDAVLVLETLRLLLRTGLLLCLVPDAAGILRRNDSREPNSTFDGMPDRQANHCGPTNAVLRLERRELRQ
jgi:hypothetical protein